MFKTLVKRLFLNIKKNKKPNYFYFEAEKNSAEKQQPQASAELQNTIAIKPLHLTSVEERHQQDFYDYLFGQPLAHSQNDELSQHIAEKIELLLKKPQSMLDVMPVLPASLTLVMEQLNNDDFNLELLLQLIKQEPAIAAKVIELANSSFYNRAEKEITDLKSAFMLLGRDGLIEGVINGFISKISPQSTIYFKQYGNKIWQHSLATGVITKELIKSSNDKSEAAQGYLIGLICNLGDMIIYQLLMDAFAFVHPDSQPDSYAFKALLQNKSKLLTYHIAKHWQFPQSILDALAVQVKLTKSSMLANAFRQRAVACFVYEANIISELQMLFEHKKKTAEQIHERAAALLYSEEAKKKIDTLIVIN